MKSKWREFGKIKTSTEKHNSKIIKLKKKKLLGKKIKTNK